MDLVAFLNSGVLEEGIRLNTRDLFLLVITGLFLFAVIVICVIGARR